MRTDWMVQTRSARKTATAGPGAYPDGAALLLQPVDGAAALGRGQGKAKDRPWLTAGHAYTSADAFKIQKPPLVSSALTAVEL